MKTRTRSVGALAIALLVIGPRGSVLAHGAGAQYRNDDRAGQYAGSLDPRQHGYEHAYRDGADRGRQDRESGAGYHFNGNDYQSGARDYERAFGNKGEYMSGHREGYKVGYDDGYYDRTGRYGQLYGQPPGGSRTPALKDPYASRSRGYADRAFDAGYRDGVTIGQEDQARNVRSNFRATDAYQRADLGYRPSDGDREAHRLQFRDGFERGYQDGYGRSRLLH